MIILPSEKFPTFKDSNFINNILQLSIIIVIGIVIFYKLLSGFFVTDDFLLIYRAAEEEINAKSIFTPYLDMPFGKFFRPLSLLFFSGLFKIVSINPFYYHFTSILFHCFNSFLVLKICESFFTKKKIFSPSLIAGLVFLLLPRNVEAVAVFNSFNDLLATSFVLSSYFFFIKFLKSDSRISLISSLFLFLFSLLVKESVILFPLIIVITSFWLPNYQKRSSVQRRTLLIAIISFFFIVVFYFILRFYLIGFILTGDNEFTNYEPIHLISFIIKGLLGFVLFPDIVKLFPNEIFENYPLYIKIILLLIGLALMFIIIKVKYNSLKERKIELIFLFSAITCLLPASIYSFSLYATLQNRFLYMPYCYLTIFFALFMMKTVWNKPRKIISIAILILAGISTTNQLTAYSIGFETSKSIFRKFVNNTDVFLKYDSLIILDAPLRIGDAAIVPTAEEFLLSFYVLEDQQGNWFLKKSDSDVPKHIDFLSYISMPSGILTYEVEWYIHKDTLFGNVTDNCYFEMNAKDRDGVAILKETMNYTLTGDSRNGSHYLWKSVKLYPFSSISSSTGFFSLRSGKIEQLFKNDNSDL